MANRTRSVQSPLVLIANDQEWSARSLESILAPNGYEVLRAFTGQQTLEQARAASPDLIILDTQLPDVHGFEICRAIRDESPFGATTPIVMTTSGPSGRAQRLEAYRAGAWEFLGQPLDGEALLLKLRTFIQAKVESDGMRDRTLLDESTGLYNMKGLARRAKEIGAIAVRRKQAVSAVVFTPGDDGEELESLSPLAEQVGQVIRRKGRASDAIARLSGSEFAVIAPETGDAEVRQLLDRFDRTVAEETADDAGNPIRIRAGYCAVPNFADSPVDAIELLLRATSALRDLREAGGKERVRAFVG
jgi:PleD family two-component response regulator